MELNKETIREWLQNYAWIETTQEQKAAVTECILSQDNWHHIEAQADKFAGAQWEPGPEAFSEGIQFHLSALYECHGDPHQITCPVAIREMQRHQARSQGSH
jgi:hypothetical protein